MIPAEVDVAIAYYVGLFGKDVSDDFVSVWVEKLEACEADDVRIAIDALARDGFPPNIIQIRDRAMSEAHYRQAQLAPPYERKSLLRSPEPERHAGVSFGEYLASDPKAKALLERIREAVPERGPVMTATEREEWGQLKPPKRDPIRLNMCAGVGKYGIELAGVMCCPDCSAPIAEGCGTRVDRAKVTE